MDIRPQFYDDFSCLADGCQHSCCRGWEIDVDSTSAERYQVLPGPLGEELRANLQRDAEGVFSFRLTETEDCPFLRPDGLCRLILERGEDFLCDICALHPRFFEDVGEHELSGVGLCCEAATALLLEGDGPLLFLTNENEPLTLGELLPRLGISLPSGALAYVPTVDAARYEAIFRRYAACEAIDQAWADDLAQLRDDPAGCAETALVYIKSYRPALFQRIFDYILYRQLERLEEYGLPTLLGYSREAADFIFLWTARTGDLAECLRRWSAQIEYSTENVGRLLDGLSASENA